MIPKIIHYCWFGNSMPKKIKKNIDGWKMKLSDYEIIEWNEKNVDISSLPTFTQEAFKLKKWAFVSDFIRLKVLYEIGGIYLDTDVEVVNTFDHILEDSLAISFEDNDSLCTAVICSQKCNRIIGDFLETYNYKSFILENSINNTPNSVLLYKFLVNAGYNLTFNNEYLSDEIHIYPRDVFGAKDIHTYQLLTTNNTIAIHHLDASWYSPGKKILKKIKKVVMYLINLFR